MPAKCNEPQISIRPAGEFELMSLSAASTDAAVVASNPTERAAEAIASAGSGFCSPGMVTAANAFA